MASTAAPGRLEIVQSFVNTVEIEDTVDALGVNGELEQWCTESGLCRSIDEEGLTQLRAFREALRAVLLTHTEEGDVAEGWRALEPFLGRAMFTMRLTPLSIPALTGSGLGADAVIAELLAIAYDAAGDGTWKRLKACRKHSCLWAFYDQSKNGSGAWCNMAVCGNRVKAQRRRSRQKNRGNFA